jgi:hypothetical protein
MAIPKDELAAIVERALSHAVWLQFPKTVKSLSPRDNGQVLEWRIDPTAAHADFRINLKQTAFDLWSQVLGLVPPVQGASYELAKGKVSNLVGLINAHACYVGIKRPIGSDDTGENVLAYVCKPKHCFQYESSMNSVVKLQILPPDVVFVIYVKLDAAYLENAENYTGVVSHWSLSESDLDDPMLPRDATRRFSRRLW